MDDDANDRREGYADGIGRNAQPNRSDAYRAGLDDGFNDRMMLNRVAEWKRRAALPVPA